MMNHEEFHILYNRYAHDIYKFALFMTGDTDDAKDITSEVFVRIFSMKAPIVKNTIKAYLLKIARNLVLENHRRRETFRKYAETVKNGMTVSGQSEENSHELADTLAFMKQFSEEDRTALLFRAEGLSYQEIAEALNISVSSAKIKVHRLRKKLLQWKIENERSNP